MGITIKGQTYYGPRIITTGLVLFLDAADKRSYPGSGILWYDMTLNSNHGTLTNGALYGSDNWGNITFDGTNDFVSISDSSTLEPSTTISIEVAFKMSAKSTYNTLVVKPYDGPPWTPPYASYMLRIQSSVLQIGMALDETWQTTNHFFDYAVDNFYHVVWTYNIDGTNAFYKNGELVSLDSPIGSATTISYSTPPVLIGAGYGSSPIGETFAGNIYFVRIYNTYLSALDVKTNFKATKSRFGLR